MKKLGLAWWGVFCVLGATPPVTGPAAGSLVIIGGGAIGPEITAKMIELAGGVDAPWVVIPTAGEAENYDARSLEGGVLQKAGIRNVTVLHTRDRAVASREEFAAPLRTARGVFFPGGRQWRLVDSYLGTPVEREIKALLGRGGVVAGTSAGATIMGSYLVRGARSGNTVMMAPGYEQGFGLLAPVAIDQHLRARRRESDLLAVVERYPDLLGIGIDEGTAVVVERGAFSVLGPGKVAIYEQGRSYYWLEAGARFDLAQRVPVGRESSAAPSRPVGPIPAMDVRRASGAIVVDGKLNDASWSKAVPVEFLFPWEAQTGAKQRTTARLLWDDQFLYVGYDCDDADIVAHYDQRDDPTYRDDAVEIFINPNPANQNYFGLEMNAKAVLYDYFAGFPTAHLKRIDFKGVQLAVHHRGTLNQTGDRDQGWSLEVAIPWSNFEELARKTPPEAGASWTINLNRWDGVEPARRLSQWSDSALPAPNPHNPGRFGRITFRAD